MCHGLKAHLAWSRNHSLAVTCSTRYLRQSERDNLAHYINSRRESQSSPAWLLFVRDLVK